MTPAASSPAFEFTSIVALTPLCASETICPPAPEMRALIQTEYPSYLLACTATVPPLSDASVMIWSHVTGLFMSMPVLSTKDLRYQSTWVLDQNGKTTSLPFQVPAATAPLNDCCWSRLCTSCGIGARKPALDISAVKGGSRLIRSMPESCAASRRDSWTRCWVASCGSTWVAILYWSVLQFLATAS